MTPVLIRARIAGVSQLFTDQFDETAGETLQGLRGLVAVQLEQEHPNQVGAVLACIEGGTP